MTRTRSLFALAVLAAAACNRPAVVTPRYAAEIFSEDSVPAHITVAVTGELQMSLNGAAFYSVKQQPIVVTPAVVSFRGVGTATISARDSMARMAMVPAGIHPDSADSKAIVGRSFTVSRAAGDAEYKVEVARP